MARKILTPQQETALGVISKTAISKSFYFTGGTALSHYYLQHRYSEDLDFFSVNEFESEDIMVLIGGLKKNLGFVGFESQQVFNRNLFFLKYSDGYELKLEFTYFPFDQVNEPKIINGVMVDSLIDIAVNKLFTIHQKPRGRDYFDLYAIMQKDKSINIPNLRLMAKQKFDWNVDVLQLGANLIKVDELLDDPILKKNIDISEVIEFFNNEAKKLSSEVLK